MNIPLPSARGVYLNEEQLRLMTRVARMYHELQMRQGDIARELHISQPRVSRLLKRASEVGIVRTTVVLPHGVHTDLEEQLETRYGLLQAIVVDTGGTEAGITRGLGAATAEYLAATLLGTDTVGISSWSATLLEVVNAMRPFRTPVVDTVVQLVGGLGAPGVQMEATRLLGQFAANTGAEPLMLPAPGVLDSADARTTFMNDSVVSGVVQAWSRLTVALVGIGAIEPSHLARESGNIFADADLALLEQAGAVGDVCFRFYDEDGRGVQSDFNDRVIGIPPGELLGVPRRIGVAGGERKYRAVRAAVRGAWVNVLVTDVGTARALLEEA